MADDNVKIKCKIYLYEMKWLTDRSDDSPVSVMNKMGSDGWRFHSFDPHVKDIMLFEKEIIENG